MGFTRGSDYSKERTFKDVADDETLEKFMKKYCKCKPQDNNTWYIKDNTEHENKYISCRGCGEVVESV